MSSTSSPLSLAWQIEQLSRLVEKVSTNPTRTHYATMNEMQKAIAENNRRKILEEIRTYPGCTTSDLEVLLRMSVKKHLKVLLDRGDIIQEGRYPAHWHVKEKS